MARPYDTHCGVFCGACPALRTTEDGHTAGRADGGPESEGGR